MIIIFILNNNLYKRAQHIGLTPADFNVKIARKVKSKRLKKYTYAGGFPSAIK